MDYDLIHKPWIKDLDATHDFPYKLGVITKYVLEAETFESFIICTFDSSPSEWINLRIEPTRHLLSWMFRRLLKLLKLLKTIIPRIWTWNEQLYLAH